MRAAGAISERLPSPINSTGYEASPHLAPDGWLYFASMRAGGAGQGDIYRAKGSATGWAVEPLGNAINSPTGEWNVTLSPDGSMMVFEASGPPDQSHGQRRSLPLMHGERRMAARQAMDALNTDGSDLDFRFIGPREGVFTSATIGGGRCAALRRPRRISRAANSPLGVLAAL